MAQLITILGAEQSTINVGLLTHLLLIPIYPELQVLDPIRYPSDVPNQLQPGSIVFDPTREVADVRLTPGAAKWQETLQGSNQYGLTFTAGLHGNELQTRTWLDRMSDLRWLAAVRQTDGTCFLLGEPDSGGLTLSWSRAVETGQNQQLVLAGTSWHAAWLLPSLDPTVLFGSAAEFDISFDSSFSIY